LDRRSALHLSDLAGAITRNNPMVAQLQHAHLPLASLFGIVNREATTLAFADAAMFLALLSIVLAPLVFVMKKPQVHAGPRPAPSME
ncbi:MAG: hypothetical protein JOY59_01190, partial [Candidatus Eremiobacteraeota bacterium]|nr:hypothetical protein [Candidatus Eremiobacteraeota bacterium]